MSWVLQYNTTLTCWKRRRKKGRKSTTSTKSLPPSYSRLQRILLNCLKTSIWVVQKELLCFIYSFWLVGEERKSCKRRKRNLGSASLSRFYWIITASNHDVFCEERKVLLSILGFQVEEEEEGRKRGIDLLQSSFEKKLADTCGMMQKKELWVLKESKETKKAKASFVYKSQKSIIKIAKKTHFATFFDFRGILGIFELGSKLG